MNTQPANSCNPEKWVEKYADDLFAWAFQRTGNRVLSDDIVLETFLTALPDVKNRNTENNERAWLFSILRTKILHHFHEAVSNLKSAEGFFLDEEKNESFKRLFFDKSGNWKKSQRPVNWHSEEEKLPDDGEFMSILKMCLKLLPEQSRCIISLRFMDERDTSVICKELDIAPSELWAIMQQAKLQLRNCIEENWLND